MIWLFNGSVSKWRKGVYIQKQVDMVFLIFYLLL